MPERHASAFRIEDLEEILGARTTGARYPHASTVIDEVVVYDAEAMVAAHRDPALRTTILDELADVLLNGPGVFAVRGAIDGRVLEPATRAFEQMITDQRAAGHAVGDHFAAVGVNDRVWNALEKLALRDPDAFVDYYSSEVIAIASLAWLGPGYQVTSQVNVVNPGGQAQNQHRDYHLGFMSSEQAAAFPRHVHAMSPLLTLQGVIAHCDMPLASGPTKILPHSQKYAGGYVHATRNEVAELFEARQVQVELRAGDAVFLNPAVIHAAGANVTADVRRVANLLQVSSAFGRAMESVDRTAIVRAVWPALRSRRQQGWPMELLDNVLRASAEAYAFPTNLDRNPPLAGLAPASQLDLVMSALDNDWSDGALHAALDDLEQRHRTN